MADRWTDERDWRAAQRAERIRRGDDVNDDYGQADFTQREPRSFGPHDAWGRSGQDRVLGERGTGESYARGRGEGGRFYGDDGRERIWREEYGQGGRYYGVVPRGYDAGAGDRDERWAPGFEPSPGRTWSGGTGGYDYERGYGEGPRAPSRFERGMRRAGEAVGHWLEEARETYRGRGPKGYQRSDERIAEEVHERLTEDPWVDASSIAVSVTGGEVTLSGTVMEREAKHRAERLVEDLTGVTHVQNNLRVERPLRNEPTKGVG